MRNGESFAVGELTDLLGVTATAVRQRIERILELELIDREKVVAGRGRPTFRYRLTVTGHRDAGANPADLADAMWREIVAVEDDEIRNKLVSAVGARLGQQYAMQFEADRQQHSFEDRMQQLSDLMSARQMVTQVNTVDELPVLDICVCPYPTLTGASDDRAMCRLEEQMISEALGQPMHLSSCRLDGDGCCQFSAVTLTADGSPAANP